MRDRPSPAPTSSAGARAVKAPAPNEAVSHVTRHRGAGGDDKVPMRRDVLVRGSLIGICQGSVDRCGGEE